MVVLTEGSMITTPERSNTGDEVAVLVAAEGMFSTNEGTSDTPSRTSDTKPSSMVVKPESGLTVFSRVSSPRERASHDEIHTKRIIEKIIIVKTSATLFLI